MSERTKTATKGTAWNSVASLARIAPAMLILSVLTRLVGITAVNATVMAVTVFLVADFVNLEGATYFETLLIFIPVGTVLYGTLLLLLDRKAYTELFNLGPKLIT